MERSKTRTRTRKEKQRTQEKKIEMKATEERRKPYLAVFTVCALLSALRARFLALISRTLMTGAGVVVAGTETVEVEAEEEEEDVVGGLAVVLAVLIADEEERGEYTSSADKEGCLRFLDAAASKSSVSRATSPGMATASGFTAACSLSTL